MITFKHLSGLIFTAIVLGPSLSHADEKIHLTTEDYAPFNFIKEEKIVGIGPDQAELIMQKAGIDFELEMMQWSRAIGLAKNNNNTCVFTADRTPERDQEFKWVEPLYVDRMVLVKTADNKLEIDSLDQAKVLNVGVQSGDSTEEVLKTAQFKNIEATPKLRQSVKKLLANRIDVLAVSADYFNVLKQQGHAVEELITLREIKSGFACNKGISDETIARMQVALDDLVKSGDQERIITQYR